jgi:hypothetical protein
MPEMLKNRDFQGITLGVLRGTHKSVRMTIPRGGSSMKLLFAFVALMMSCSAVVAGTEAPVGFYTHYVVGENELCKSLDTDHVVSKKEARDRGLPESRHEEFDNDPENQVEACDSINRSKKDSGPADFLRRSRDGKYKDYEIVNWEEYLYIYYKILHKYDLLRTGVVRKI